MADLIVRICANLESDTVEDLWIEDSNLSSQVEDTRCSQVMQLERQKVFSQDGPGDLETLFDREELLRAYQEGRRWLSAEYRRVDSGGNTAGCATCSTCPRSPPHTSCTSSSIWCAWTGCTSLSSQ